MDSRAREIVRIGNKLHDDKRSLNNLWQQHALNFYPERADFTSPRTLGDEDSDHLFSSYPVLARRELGNLIAANTRPRDTKWVSIHVDDEEADETEENRRFLEYLTDVQYKAMYDRPANFVRSTKETDHDLVTFGQGVLQISLNTEGSGLLYRNWHLRDCAWSDNAECHIDNMHRNLKPTARQLVQLFGKKCSKEVLKAYEKDPEKTFSCRHVVMPSRLYKFKHSLSKREMPFTSFYVEIESETVLEEVGQNRFGYVIPRWHTVSGSQYAVSMATSVLLPDGRTLQVMMRTLREAGENYVNPPLIAVAEAIRGDIALYPGGVTTADRDYDERLGDVLRPISKDKSGFPIGLDLAASLKEDIRAGFLLDKIQLPEVSKTMTATEVRRRLEEHVRASAPIFEPITEDYSEPVCSATFEILLENGVFPTEFMPQGLRGKDVKFKFRTPMQAMTEQTEAQAYIDIRDQVLVPMLQIDPAQMEGIDLTTATRDAMRTMGWRAKWFKTEEAIAEARAKQAEEAEAAKMAEQIGQMGALAEQGGKGINALVTAGQSAQG